MRGVKDFFEPGYRLAKAGVILMEQINARGGKGTVGVGSAWWSAGWNMQQQRKTSNYTGDVDRYAKC